MKISKKVGQGMKAVGIAGVVASFGGCYYFGNKSVEMEKMSPEHVRAAEIDRELFRLEKTVFKCGEKKDPVSKYTEKKLQPDAPQNAQYDLFSTCVEAKVRQHDSLQEERNTLVQSASYLKVERQKEVYWNHSLGFGIGGTVSFLLVLAVGSLAVQRRREEDLEEKEAGEEE